MDSSIREYIRREIHKRASARIDEFVKAKEMSRCPGCGKPLIRPNVLTGINPLIDVSPTKGCGHCGDRTRHRERRDDRA